MGRVMHILGTDENGSSNSSESVPKMCVTRLQSRKNVVDSLCEFTRRENVYFLT